MADYLGIYAASVTPFDREDNINAEALLKLMERNLKEGTAGFFIGGSSAEFLLMTFQERVLEYEIASAFVGKCDMIAHVGALATKKAVGYAKAAKKCGYNHIAAIPPIYYGFTTREICDYFYDISRAVDMPVIIYNFPGNTKREIDLRDKDWAALLKSEAVEGIKHTNQVVYQMERIMAHNPKLKIWDGFDETMIACMAYGCTGAIGTTFNIMLPHYQKLFDAFRAGKLTEARELQRKANNIMEALVNVGLISATKYILTRQGIDAGPARKPFSQLTDEQKAYVDGIWDANIVV
ncbi:MAG: dihydrodipicolinate synthase family protein [Fusobacteriaceae bacterium]|jgi:N-acetylneuraminate lyase|nr:dihydrodipicolinate synthase family protein [Fusobacteriaceae bacterium]